MNNEPGKYFFLLLEFLVIGEFYEQSRIQVVRLLEHAEVPVCVCHFFTRLVGIARFHFTRGIQILLRQDVHDAKGAVQVFPDIRRRTPILSAGNWR
jgi:hypothetical protein